MTWVYPRVCLAPTTSNVRAQSTAHSNPMAGQQVHVMTADIMSPDATCTRPTMPVDEPCDHQPAEAVSITRQQHSMTEEGAQEQTNASAQSTLCSHPHASDHHAGHGAHADDLHDNDTNIAQAAVAVDEGERTGITRPPHTPVEHPRPPDNANEVKHAGTGSADKATQVPDPPHEDVQGMGMGDDEGVEQVDDEAHDCAGAGADQNVKGKPPDIGTKRERGQDVLRFAPILFFSSDLLFFSRDYSSIPRHRPADHTCLRNRFLPPASSDFSDSSPLTHMYFFVIPSHSTMFLLLCHRSGAFRVSGI